MAMIKANYVYKDYEKALNKQKERYFKRIENMMAADLYKCYFLTFTFTDKTLKRTTPQTRLRFIKSFLNNQASDYVLNIDYDEKNGREHYHAFILSRYAVINTDAYKKYGFLKVKKPHQTLTNFYKSKITIDTDDRHELTAENLTAHAFKDSTRQAKIIYSRDALKVNYRFKRKAEKKLSTYKCSDLGKANKKAWQEITKGDTESRRQAEKERAELEQALGLDIE